MVQCGSVPLYKLTGSNIKQNNLQWSNEHDLAFQTLKPKLTEIPLLVYPNRTNLCKMAIAAKLLQAQNGLERIVFYGSFILTPPQKNIDLLAIVCFTRQCHHFLLGCKFMIWTDHNSLVWLMRFLGTQGQLARWIEELSQFTIQHANLASLR